jgi:hypothetical protein
MGFIIILLALCLAPDALGLDARPSPADYPMQASTKDMKLGVEYMVRSFLADHTSFSIDDYLLVEIGVFPDREAALDLRRFILRINGKTLLHSQTPGMVAASVKYPDWRIKPSVEAGVMRGDGRAVIVGRNPQVQRWPGDPRQSPAPPERNSPVAAEKEPIDYAHLINRSALPEGKFNKPLAGFAFFPYDGKLKSIRTVELLIDDQVLKLR